MAVAGRKAQVKVSGTPTALTNEPTTDLGSPVRQHFQITNAAKRVLDPNGAIVVQKDIGAGYVTAAASEYTLNRLNGKIDFLAQLAVPGTCRIASGNYLPMAVVGECKAFQLRLVAAWPTDNIFGDAWNTRDVAALKDASGNIGKWNQVPAAGDLEAIFEAGSPVMLEFWSDSGAALYDFRVWALLNRDQISAAVAGLIEEAVDWEGTPDADKRLVAWD